MAEVLPAENDVAQELRQLAQAYPEDVFGPITPDEVKQHSSLITRNSAAMGRHFSKTFTKAADEIERLKRAVESSGLKRLQADPERDCAVEDAKRLHDALVTIRHRISYLAENSRFVVGSERWTLGQDMKVTMRVISDAIGADTRG